jgi:hypothetical protein
MAIWIYGGPTLVGIGDNSILSQINVDWLQNLSFSKSIYSAEIATRCSYIHNIVLLAIWSLLMAYIIFKYIFYPIIRMIFGIKRHVICCCCKRKPALRNDYEPTVTEALNYNGLYKTYVLRKLAYLFKGQNNGLESYQNLKKFYEDNLRLEKRRLIEKVRNLSNKSYQSLDRNFDEEIKGIIKSIDKNEESLIQRDFSYNIGVYFFFKIAHR